MSVGPGHFLALSGLVGAIAVFGLVARRDGPGLAASLAMFLLAPAIAFAGAAETGGGAGAPPQGAVVALVLVGAALALALVAAALVAVSCRRTDSLDLDESQELEA